MRVPGNAHAGFGAILDEVRARYAAPLALTEVQLSCTREEQMRWLLEAWTQSNDRRQKGMDVIAVTPWALFGSVDWGNLVTRCEGKYEVGAFDIRSKRPRRTALARMIQSLAKHAHHEHPVLRGAGWWNRATNTIESESRSGCQAPPILLLGGAGVLGREILRQCERRELHVVSCPRAVVDIADHEAIKRAIETHMPWAVINAAGFSRVERAERDVAQCVAANQRGAANVASACARRGLPLLTYSTHMVFGGERHGAYRENDETTPVNTYGRSKVAAERLVQYVHPRALVVRSGPFLGATDGSDFVERVLRHLADGRRLPVSGDMMFSPTYLPDLAAVSLDLLIDDESGIWHLCNGADATWSTIASQCAERAGMDIDLICPLEQADWGRRSRLPMNTVMESNHGTLLPGLDSVLDRMFETLPLGNPTRLGEVA